MTHDHWLGALNEDLSDAGLEIGRKKGMIKTTNEIVEKIMEQVDWFHVHGTMRLDVRNRIEFFITAYADERVKDEQIKTGMMHQAYLIAIEQRDKAIEALSGQKCKDCGCTYEGCCCNPIREMKARAEALEEAAKVAESYLMIGGGMNPQFKQIAENLSDQIRALKAKP